MDASPNLTGTIRVHPDVVWRDVDGEIVLLNVVTGQYFGLDEVGSRVWVLLTSDGDAGASLEVLRDRVVAEFEVEAPAAQADLTDLLTQLLEQQLIAVGAAQS
jgi:hypothetical protein